MSDDGRLLAGSTWKNGWMWTLIVAGVVLTGMELIWGREWGTRGSLAVIGGIALFAALVIWTVLFFRRRWLKVESDRFQIDGPGFHQTWRDVEVEALCWSVKKNYVNGLPKSETCRLELVDAKGRKGLLRHTRPLDGEGPFLQFANRILDGAAVRMREQLSKGMEMKGEGWRLGREALSFKDGEIKVAEVTGVAEFDGQIRVWKKGSNDAAFGVPAGSLNATLLRRLLEELRPKEEAGGAESGGDLGRVLFERKGQGKPWMMVLVAVLAFLIGVIALPASVGWGLAILAGGVLLCVWAWWQAGLMFRCHDRGVSRRSRRGTTTIRYRDIAVYTYRATRHFVNGAYTGTTIAMEFESRPELGREKIGWSATLQGMDEELDVLRDHISKVMASRWVEDLQAGKVVEWTPNLRLTPEGVAFRPGGFLGRKDWVKAALGDLAGTSMEKGVFYLFLKGEKSSSVSEAVSAPNFFPGYYVLMAALQPPAAPSSPAAPN